MSLQRVEAGDRFLRDNDVVVEHDRVGILDLADEIRLRIGVEGNEVGDVAEHFALGSSSSVMKSATTTRKRAMCCLDEDARGAVGEQVQ